MSIISLLIVLLIFCLVIWCVRMILGAFSIGEPISSLVHVFVVILFVLWLLQNIGFIGGGPVLHLR